MREISTDVVVFVHPEGRSNVASRLLAHEKPVAQTPEQFHGRVELFLERLPEGRILHVLAQHAPPGF